MKLTSVSKFSGGGGVDLGMELAGWDHLYGIEYDDRIASVARDNGLNTITADILKIKPDDYPSMTWMHDSPPCPNFSTAKANGEETENDIALAQAVCDWIVYHRPRFYTLENVYGYRLSKSWGMIADTLHRHGYQFNYWHVNMANYGVPQTRKRMIVIARLDGKTPQLPPQTHAENPQVGLFGTKKRWVSWYEAIEDLIPTLPESHLTQRHNRIDILNTPSPFLLTNQNKRDDMTPQIVSFGPCCSLTAQSLQGWRFIDNNKKMVAKISPRSFVRIHTFPDSYVLPDNNALAFRILGNAVPPLFMQRVGEMLKASMQP